MEEDKLISSRKNISLSGVLMATETINQCTTNIEQINKYYKS